MATRGFTGRRPSAGAARRLAPGQHVTDDFPVLSFGPTPRVDLSAWRFTLRQGPRPLAGWSWAEFEAMPQTTWRGDIHCVTTWSKFDTVWQGVTIDDLFGPIGGHFVWRGEEGGPLLLIAGGSGIAPLMAMLRHRRQAAPDVEALLLYSARTWDE